METTLVQLPTNKGYLKKQLGEAFKKARQARGFSQIHVAKAMGCSRLTIARFEKGYFTVLSTIDILVLAEYLGVTLAIHPEINGNRAANMLDDLSTGDRYASTTRRVNTEEEYDPDLPCNQKGCSMSFRAYCCGCNEMLAYEAKRKGE